LRCAEACCVRLLHLLYDGKFGGKSQLVHGDLHMANVMQGHNTGDGLLHLIDFDGCAWGFPAQDLAVLLWALQFEGLEEILTGVESPQYPTLKAAILRGYTALRPLPDECNSAVDGEIVFSVTRDGRKKAVKLLDALVLHRDLVVLSWFAATDVPFLRPRVAGMAEATLRRMRSWVPIDVEPKVV